MRRACTIISTLRTRRASPHETHEPMVRETGLGVQQAAMGHRRWAALGALLLSFASGCSGEKQVDQTQDPAEGEDTMLGLLELVAVYGCNVSMTENGAENRVTLSLHLPEFDDMGEV